MDTANRFRIPHYGQAHCEHTLKHLTYSFNKFIMRDFGIAILMILGLCAFDSQAGKSKCFTEELNRLDSVLSSERPDSKREIKISGLKAALTKEIPDSSRYSILRDLYREYRLYRCDSAMLIARETSRNRTPHR